MDIPTQLMMPKVAVITEDGLISIFNRSLAGATGIDRGTMGSRFHI